MKKNGISSRSNRKKKAIFIVSLFLCVSLFVLGWFIFQDRKKDDVVEEEAVETIEEIAPSPNEGLRKQWLENKKINEDYVGQIVFDSGLIDLPFVQAKDVYKENGELHVFYDEEGNLISEPGDHTGNDVYIWTNWKTGEYDRYEEGGSVFMDFRNDLDDQNLIIYGHHFARDWDPSGSKQFTPLDILLEQEDYEANKTLKLALEDEIRTYVVTDVFILDVYDDGQLQILRTNMDTDFYGREDPGFFEGFIDQIHSMSEYDTKETLNKDDRILTLVTCIQHQPQYRQITLCRQTGSEKYD